MLINAQTKIAALLKHHPDALEAIVALSPDFKKLRNPILRKLMAGRASISMASKMGGCTPDDFFRALAPLGFEVDGGEVVEEKPTYNTPLPEYLKALGPGQIIDFDVRAMLAQGNDPLKHIQQKVKELNPGQALLIINSFEPVPLIKLLEKQGFQSFVNHIDENTIETYFYKGNQAPVPEGGATEEPTAAPKGDWENMLKQFENNFQEIDVRHLEMPMPMMAILEALETLPDEKALYVYHKRIPVFLLTELKERGFDYRINEVQDGEVYLLIFKNK